MRKISGRFGAVAGIAALTGMILAAAIAAPAQTFTTLHTFDHTDGANPFAGLVQATDGNLYGTTANGGANGSGTIFKITPSGTLTTLYSFCPQIGCSDGQYPLAALLQAADGSFYGTTYLGGSNSGGTVFKITPSGMLTTLYSFCSHTGCVDGLKPFAGLLQATNGNFYGTTFYGGVNGNGTVFKMTPSGTLTTLYSFGSGGPDGENPYAGLTEATDGNFYGTTGGGYGTVFKITPSGTLTTLYSFCSQSGCTDGVTPYAGALLQAADGNLYGTTYSGGASGWGTVFRITLGGALITLHSFDLTDGGSPVAGLLGATDGNFYGITYTGGANNNSGTIFKITPGGTLTTLYSFCSQSSCSDGDLPFATLVQDTSGKVYGTTVYGGEGSMKGDVKRKFSPSTGRGEFFLSASSPCDSS